MTQIISTICTHYTHTSKVIIGDDNLNSGSQLDCPHSNTYIYTHAKVAISSTEGDRRKMTSVDTSSSIPTANLSDTS